MVMAQMIVKRIPGGKLLGTVRAFIDRLLVHMFRLNMISHIGGLGLVATLNTLPLLSATQTSHHALIQL